ncbi:hypothetical protein [Roseococcus microcysteis]|uniref:hypothetical protein n=1 Tax=Roseococcus microcysteis TaxID=2771361 RepID=UPI00168ADFAC|nr:hypothetical protein [Roseococcus microcysteis]
MPDGHHPPAWPLLLDEAGAARFLSMSQRDFRAALAAGLVPAGRRPSDMAAAGLLDPAHAARLATLGPLWHRGEIEAHAARLWGLEGQGSVGQATARITALDALHAFQPPRTRPARAATPQARPTRG